MLDSRLELCCPNEVAKIMQVYAKDRSESCDGIRSAGRWSVGLENRIFVPAFRSDPGDDNTVHEEDRTSGKVAKSGDRN